MAREEMKRFWEVWVRGGGDWGGEPNISYKREIQKQRGIDNIGGRTGVQQIHLKSKHTGKKRNHDNHLGGGGRCKLNGINLPKTF